MLFSGLPFEGENGYKSRSKIGSIPSATASNFRFNPATGILVFSAYIYPDGDLKTVSDQDREWEERGNSALVYDKTYVRHWDVWQGQKRPQLFSIKVEKEDGENWKLGEDFTSPLKGTRHVSQQWWSVGNSVFMSLSTVCSCRAVWWPGWLRCFGNSYCLYLQRSRTTRSMAHKAKCRSIFLYHTANSHILRQVYIVPISGSKEPTELTSGKQGATHNPAFNTKGTKVAWLELDEDGYESDRCVSASDPFWYNRPIQSQRAKIVIYDLTKRVRFTITQAWDRSPGELAVRSISIIRMTLEYSRCCLLQFSKDDDFLYLTAGDGAKIKVFVLPVPPTPLESTTHPKLDSKYSTPVPLTQSKAASGLQILPGRILFSQSSFTTPNDVYVINDLRAIERAILADTEPLTIDTKIERISDFWTAELGGKNLSEGEEFWFRGAEGKSVQGWTLKPKGWKDADIKKWPAVLLIHGGYRDLQQMTFGDWTHFYRSARCLGRPMVNAMESKWLWLGSSFVNFAHCLFNT